MNRFEYALTEQQYQRFVQDPNTTAEIDNLGRLLGVDVRDGNVKGESWVFDGKCEGTARLIEKDGGHAISIQIKKKPWYLFDWFLDWGFRKALK